MSKEISYGGTTHFFPDDFTEQDIQKSLQVWDQKNTPPKTVGGFLSNIPSSAGNLLSGIGQTLMHPEEIVKTVAGGMESMLPETFGGVQSYKADVPQFESVKQALIARYGGWENLKETAYKDPVGFMADVSGLLSAGGGLVKGLGSLGAKAGVSGSSIATGAGKALTSASQATDPLRWAVKGVTSVANKTAPFVSEVAGKMTGTGGEAIRMAANGSPSFTAAMRGDVGWTDILSDLKGSLQEVKDARGAAYRQKLATIAESTKQLDLTPVRQQMNDLLDRYNVKMGEPKMPSVMGMPAEEFIAKLSEEKQAKLLDELGELPDTKHKLDFSESTIHDSEAQTKVKAIFNDVMTWKDTTPLGVDILKRRIADFYSPSSQARQIVQSLENRVRGILIKEVPEYKAMTQDYAIASDFINKIEREFSVGPNAHEGTGVRKLSYALNQNNDYRKLLVEALGKQGGGNLKEQIAGASMSSLAPRGLAGVAGGSYGLYGALSGQPSHLLALAAASPRLVGETLAAISSARKSKVLGPTAKVVFDPATYRFGTYSNAGKLKKEP